MEFNQYMAEQIKPKYRALREKEVIQRGDQWRLAGTDSWFYVSDSIGFTVKEQLAKGDINYAMAFRRETKL